MDGDFRITTSWEKRYEPSRFDRDDYADVTELFLSLREFIALYEGTFDLRIAGYDLHFDFSPDLSTVFEGLPEILECLTKDTPEPVSLEFFEQGTDITLVMQREEEEICISFSPGSYAGERFRGLPGGSLAVPADRFLREWLRFLHAVLGALLQLDPSLVQDESYADYVDQLEKVEDKIR